MIGKKHFKEMKMSNNQGHGFTWEDLIIQAITNMTKKELNEKMEGGHCHRVDIPNGTWGPNRIRVETDITVKSCQKETIYCSDITNFIETLKRGVKLVLGRYEQYPLYKQFHTVMEWDIKPLHFPKIVGTMDLKELESFVKYVKTIPPGRQAQLDNQVRWKEKRDDILFNTNSKLTIDAKIDSKKQRRTQCGLSIRDLSMVVEPKVFKDEYDGLQLPLKIKSTARQFNVNPYVDNFNKFFA